MSATRAIQANNAGVELFESGLLEQAIRKYEAAVREMATLLLGDDDPQFVLPSDASHQVQYHQPILGWSQPSHVRPAQGLRVFTRAAYLEPIFSPFGVSTYTAVPLFNLGLAHHMKSLKDREPPDQSSKIYESVMGSLQESKSFDDANVLLLHLALFTNCGQILSGQVDNKRGALECFETSCRILTWLYLRNAALTVLDEGELRGILGNMDILHDRCRSLNDEMDLAVCAAAA